MAGGVDDLPAIETLLILLPETAYGQVFVETPAEVTPLVLLAPPRVTVTQLSCGPDAVRGQLLAAAVQAWLAEWMPEEPEPVRSLTLWVGSSARDQVTPTGATLESL